MDTIQTEKKAKSSKPLSHAAIRVKKETRKRLLSDLAKVNKKDFGRRVRADEYLSVALSLVSSEHVRALQESSLSNADRLSREHQEYVAKNGAISKDEYLGKRLRGEFLDANVISEKT